MTTDPQETIKDHFDLILIKLHHFNKSLRASDEEFKNKNYEKDNENRSKVEFMDLRKMTDFTKWKLERNYILEQINECYQFFNFSLDLFRKSNLSLNEPISLLEGFSRLLN